MLVQLVVAFAIVCTRVFPADGNHLLVLGVVPVGGNAHKLSCGLPLGRRYTVISPHRRDLGASREKKHGLGRVYLRGPATLCGSVDSRRGHREGTEHS